jgi:hypothetical protein
LAKKNPNGEKAKNPSHINKKYIKESLSSGIAWQWVIALGKAGSKKD